MKGKSLLLPLPPAVLPIPSLPFPSHLGLSLIFIRYFSKFLAYHTTPSPIALYLLLLFLNKMIQVVMFWNVELAILPIPHLHPYMFKTSNCRSHCFPPFGDLIMFLCDKSQSRKTKFSHMDCFFEVILPGSGSIQRKNSMNDINRYTRKVRDGRYHNVLCPCSYKGET